MTEVGPASATPMMQQYRELKRRFPDHLLLFRLGDFYELFAEDAELGARLLSITLTARQSVPMAGIPHHAADGYIARLVQAGQKIAVCEQLEAPGKGRKLLRRDVVREDNVLRHGALALDPVTHTVTKDGQPVELSAREFALLAALLERPGAALSKAQLEERIYRWGEEVESNAVEVHVHNLRKKLGNETIRTLRGIGYALA